MDAKVDEGLLVGLIVKIGDLFFRPANLICEVVAPFLHYFRVFSEDDIEFVHRLFERRRRTDGRQEWREKGRSDPGDPHANRGDPTAPGGLSRALNALI